MKYVRFLILYSMYSCGLIHNEKVEECVHFVPFGPSDYIRYTTQITTDTSYCKPKFEHPLDSITFDRIIASEDSFLRIKDFILENSEARNLPESGIYSGYVVRYSENGKDVLEYFLISQEDFSVFQTAFLEYLEESCSECEQIKHALRHNFDIESIGQW